MTDEDRITQHLEMMIHKRSRCEDWVASVQTKTGDDKKEKYDFDFNDEFSDLTDSNENNKRRFRKTVNPQRLPLTFLCEWNSCSFVSENERINYFSHVSNHIKDLAIVKKNEDSECYQCMWESCNFQSTNVSEIKRHVNYHAYHTILKAVALELHNLWDFPRCKLDGENRNWLPDLSYPFECCYEECDYTCDNFQTFLNHVHHHVLSIDFSSKKEVACKWRGCVNFKCKAKTRLKIHFKRHTGEKTLACPTCGALFATNTKYMDHCIRKIPEKIECNRCQYCLRYFSSERLLRDHMRYHINSYKCSFCDMTCSTPATLANHVRYRHLNEKPFRCTECPFTSKSAEDSNAHMATHDAEPRYQCEADNCDFSCRTMTTFKKHFKSVHLMENGPIYCCHLCDKKYNRGPRLGNHLRTKHQLEHPPGHTRFRYMENIDGYFRLQVERYESLELNDVQVSITHINEQPKNYVLQKDPSSDGENSKKFTVCVKEPEQRNKGALIAIDIVDEEGNILRTSTVQEEVIERDQRDIIFVDVNQQEAQCENRTETSAESVDNANHLQVNQNHNQTIETSNLMTIKQSDSGFVFVDVNETENQEKSAPSRSPEGSTVINPILDSHSVNSSNNTIRKRPILKKRTVKFSDNDDNVEFIVKQN
ncbi:histone H4 transcription factor [Planococcus citri]|uniref:histone H4 transcription factor n=1 Tax=Planococcus citri TaxID=170843 RepID=UPI0031F9E615